jgi:hypothetical protein
MSHIKLNDVAFAVGQIVLKAHTELGYRASSRYIQIFRSLAPVSASLGALAKEIPSSMLFKIIKKGLFRSFVYGGLKYFILKWPTALMMKMASSTNQSQKPLVKTKSNQTLSARAMQCKMLFVGE